MGAHTEPRWLRIAVVVPALAFAAMGSVGLLLADLGQFRTALVAPLVVVVLAALVLAARPLLRAGGRPGAATQVASAAAVALAVVDGVWNGTNASEHVQINRDGAVYLDAGKWIARHGTIDVRAATGPFAHAAGLSVGSSGMRQRGAHLEFSLSHLYSAVLAGAQRIGGDRAMFVVGPVLGALALLAFYVLACRLLRSPVAALGAAITLALLLPQVSFSRDTVTEIPIQVLLFTAVWALCDESSWRSGASAYVAGLLLGLVEATHVDGLAFLVGLPAVYATVWMRTGRGDRRRVARAGAWSAGGVVTGLLLAALDLARWDRSYLDRTGVNLLRVAAAAGAVAVIVAALLLARRTHAAAAVRDRRPVFAAGAAALTLAGGLGLWLARPLVQTARGSENPFVRYVQGLNGLPIDGTRRYDELSLRWISWYVGPVALAVAILAAATVVYAVVRGRARTATLVAAAMLAPPALLYVWKPSITPDHVWAARRFVPVVFPAVVLLAFAAIHAVSQRRGPRGLRPAGRLLAVALAAIILGGAAYAVSSVPRMTEQRGQYATVEAACRLLGDDGAAVVLRDARSIAYLSDPQTLRSFCDVPVAVAPDAPDARELHALAAAWRSAGRRLYVVAEAPATIEQVLPGAPVRTTATATNRHLLELTVLRRPSRYTTERYRLAVAPVG